MVDITPSIPPDRQRIEGYGPGVLRVAGQAYGTPLIVFPGAVHGWPVTRPEDISLESLSPVIQAEPAIEVLLIGTGAKMQLLPAEVRKGLRALAFGVDIMETGAACRTYNILLSEERRVAAAVILL